MSAKDGLKDGHYDWGMLSSSAGWLRKCALKFSVFTWHSEELKARFGCDVRALRLICASESHERAIPT